MNRPEIITAYSQMYGISKRQSTEEIDRFVEFIRESLLANETLNFKNLGKFKLSVVEERNRRIPTTGELVTIEEHYKPCFRFAKTFREEVRYGFK